MSETLKYLILDDGKTVLYSFRSISGDNEEIMTKARQFHNMEEVLNSDVAFEDFEVCQIYDGFDFNNGLPSRFSLMYINGIFYEAKYCEYDKWLNFKRNLEIDKLL